MRNRVIGLIVTAALLVAPASNAWAATSWRLSNAPSLVGRIYGSVDCVKVNRCWATFSTKGHPGIVTSTNGGATWRPETLPAPRGLSFLIGLSCPTATTCVAVGEAGNPEIGSIGLVLVTHDGGATWRRAPLPTPLSTPTPGVQLFGVSCSSGATCVALGTGRLPPTTTGTTSCGPGCTEVPPAANPNATGLVAITTSNGGATWTASVVPESTPWWPNDLTCSGGSCHAVGFDFAHCLSQPSNRHCGASGAAITLGPQATTWTNDALPPGFFQVMSASCATATTCVAVGSSADSTLGHGVVARTVDGGQRWTILHPPAGTVALLTVSCVSAQTCVAGGASGNASHNYATIVSSDNGGASWAAEPLPAGLGQIGSISCVGGHCVASAAVGFGPSMRGLLIVN